MLIPLSPVKFQRRPAKARPSKAPPGPSGPPVLLEGLFNHEDTLSLLLTFDRAIAVTSFVASTLLVIDPGTGASYAPTGSPVVDGETITMNLTAVGDWSGSQTVLNASAGNGIVSASDGSAWDGVSGFVLETE